ncbi:MAG TPA: tRNA epoxyqueuosine(34) reductase QueG [Bacteroidales bacterium]|nr:tRNA epoxyqueuosine(34) reductase QueG [Bacteroidales bacterium]
MVKAEDINRIALNVGFHACGVSRAERLDYLESVYFNWLDNQYHATMGYMEQNIDLRLDPAKLVPGAKSVISVLLSYNTGDVPVNTQSPRIARYACRVDYHSLMKKMLWEMLSRMRKSYGEIKGRAFVDSAPVMEREWAVRAGLGWIGKNSNLINKELGSYVFIGELIVDIDIEPSNYREGNRCGTCTRCMDSCPSKAIVAPGTVDARKCISYVTIESKQMLSDSEIDSLNGWCFGCDICQEVCPWNRKANVVDGANQGVNVFRDKSNVSLATLGEDEFNVQFGSTPLSRAGYEKIKRAIQLMEGKNKK